MYSHLQRITVLFAIVLFLSGCGGGSDPVAPDGGGDDGDGGGGENTGELAITMLTTGLGIHAVWGPDASSMYAAGESGLIMHNDGTGWQSVASPVSSHLNAIWGTALDNIWVVGDSGTLLHFNGTAWSVVVTSLSVPLNAIWGAAADDIWVGGAFGKLMHFDGTDWTVFDSGTTRNITSIVGASTAEIWAGCSFGELLTYDGTVWSMEKITINGTDSNSHLNDIWYAPDTGTLYATGFTFYLLERQPSGDFTSSPVAGVTPLYRIWGRSSTDFYVTDFGGTVHHWNGTGYFSSTVSSGTSLPGIFGLPTGETYAVGLQGGLFHSGASSRSWEIDQKGSGWDIKAAWGTSGDNLELIAEGGNAYHYDGSGFFNYNNNVNTSLSGMWGDGAGAVYTVGWGGVVGLSGTSWSTVWTGSGGAYYGIGGLHSDLVIAVGANGTVEARGPSGWQSLAPMGTAALRGVWVADEDHSYVVGDGGTVHNLGTMDWAGGGDKIGRTSWDSDDTGVTANLVGIWGASATDMFIISNDGDILHFDGTTFTSSLDLASGQFTAIWGSSVDNVWAVGGFGLIYHYDGAVWEKVETGMILNINGVYGFGTDEVYFVMNRGTVVKGSR